MVTRMMRGVLVGLCLGFAGCWADADLLSTEAAEASVRDSAGVQIVENVEPAWGDGEGWTIELQPVLQIGVVQGDPRYEFTNPSSVSRHPDGRIAVADGTSIRLFDSTGNHLITVGRAGQGPGEFGAAPQITWAPPDTLLAWDPRSRRFSWFGGDGTLLRERMMSSPLTFNVPTPNWQVSPEGGLLATPTQSQTEDRGELSRQSIRILPHFIPPDGGMPVLLGEYDWVELLVEPAVTQGAPRSAQNNPFLPAVSINLRGAPSTIVVASTSNWEVREFQPGGSLSQVIRAPVPRTLLTEEMLDAEREQIRKDAEDRGDNGSLFVQFFDTFEVPDSLPAIARVSVDDLGNLWVARRSELVLDADRQGGPVDVIDRDGRWLGTVAVPEDVGRIRHIGQDHLVSTWQDELEVRYVRVYRILK